MAPRSRRKGSSKKENPSEDGSTASDQDVESCPACPNAPETPGKGKLLSWVMCDNCKTWYHWRCAGNGGDVDTIDKWFCKQCMELDPSRVITLKPPARKSARKKGHTDYSSLANGSKSPDHWIRMMQGKPIKKDSFKRMKGSDVGLEWLESDPNALKEPIVILTPDGLGMKMPPKGFTVEDVADAVGRDHPLEVIDVSNQSGSPGWTLGKWADYVALEPSERTHIYNVISLEISATKLSEHVVPPRIVREIDWVENFWPSTRKGKGFTYPKVQLYCLMGVISAWTDWHVDFAGSSVYYHIMHGAKTFYFIKPTAANLAAYEKWSGTELQTTTWLGDMVDEVIEVSLTEGNTMIIPTGWIHAVATPMDTLVFGGNFLHSYNVSTQLKIRDIEIRTHVPKKFQFPMFTKLCWYVGDKYLRDFKSNSPPELSTRVLSSILALAEFLVSQVRLMERGTEAAKKETKEQVPTDRVKDAAVVARELRWRVKQLMGEDSADEGPSPAKRTNGIATGGLKRKRVLDGDEEFSRFRHYAPKAWTEAKTTKGERVQRRAKTKRPDVGGAEWKEKWVEGESPESMSTETAAEEAVVDIETEYIVKLRPTENGLERHKIERTVERWNWEPQ